MKKLKKKIKKTIILVISIVFLLASCITFGYLFFKNTKLTNDINDKKTSIQKVKLKINYDEEVIENKENEYEKLKETLKEQFEELSIWEETKEKLEKALS